MTLCQIIKQVNLKKNKFGIYQLMLVKYPVYAYMNDTYYKSYNLIKYSDNLFR